MPKPLILNNIPKTAVFTPTKSFQKALSKALREKDVILESRPLLFDAISSSQNQEIILIGPVIGSPAVRLVAESLIVSGALQILLFGSAGGLGLEIGDIVVSKKASSVVSALESKKLNVVSGGIWTTDSPNLETSSKSKEEMEKGSVAVEMEYAGLLAACEQKNLIPEALLVISDTFLGSEWQRGFRSKEFKNSVEKAAEVIAEFIS